MKSNDTSGIKKKIFFSRSYRHLFVDKKESICYMLIIVLPIIILMLIYAGDITAFASELAKNILSGVIDSKYINTRTSQLISGAVNIHYTYLPTTYPSFLFSIANVAVALAAIVFFCTGKRRGKSISLYIDMIAGIHLAVSVFFMFAGSEFPYSSADFSLLYMQQQLGIWISFLLVSGLITGLLGTRAVVYRLATMLSIMLYSFVFGIARYIVFLYLINKFSMLYMGIFFFILGPFYDFLYFVSIYGLYINKMTDLYSFGKGKSDWRWA